MRLGPMPVMQLNGTTTEREYEQQRHLPVAIALGMA